MDYDKPVGNVEDSSRETIEAASWVEYSGRNSDDRTKEPRHGVIAYRRDGSYRIEFTYTESYVSDVLVPFHTYYDNTVRVDMF